MEQIHLLVAGVRIARMAVRLYDGGDHVWIRILPSSRCCLRVFDISSVKGVAPKTLARVDEVQSVGVVLGSLPSQEHNTVRVYLEESLSTNADFISHLQQVVSQASMQEYDHVPIKSGLATMITQWRHPSDMSWWKLESYDLCNLRQGSRNDTNADSVSLSAALLQRVMRFRIAEDPNGNILGE